MIIKVCGMREAENIREVETLRPDWMGFIFWPKSKRYVSERPAYLPTQCKRVGVFVDASTEEIMRKVQDFGLDIIQLHGSESPDDIRRLRSVCGDAITTIKAFNIATTEDLEATKPYEGMTDYFLFDARMPPEETGGALPPGGTGKKFDWSVLDAYKGNTPFLLSGGIGPDDAERVKALIYDRACPRCIGIDLNSRFEVAPALKDIGELKRFIEKVKQ